MNARAWLMTLAVGLALACAGCRPAGLPVCRPAVAVAPVHYSMVDTTRP